MNTYECHALTRRSFLGMTAATMVAWAWQAKGVAAAASADTVHPIEEVMIVEFSDTGVRGQKVRVPMVVKTEAEWKKALPADSFEVTRHADTEPPFTGRYWNNHEKGIYRCVCCGTAQFSSETKFESGTGWPSFWEPLAAENIATIDDKSFDMDRTEVACKRCAAHLGHVFDDGPRPTGLRYCMNSVALRFVKFA